MFPGAAPRGAAGRCRATRAHPPDAEAANTVHREAHGLVADEVHLVKEGS